MSAGYSKRRLPEKLGIKPGFRICVLNAPANYADILGALPKRLSNSFRNSKRRRISSSFLRGSDPSSYAPFHF
jgi:hypothetical protein